MSVNRSGMFEIRVAPRGCRRGRDVRNRNTWKGVPKLVRRVCLRKQVRGVERRSLVGRFRMEMAERRRLAERAHDSRRGRARRARHRRARRGVDRVRRAEPREARTANRGVDRKRGVGASREEAEHAEPAVLDTGQQLNDAMRTTVVSQPGASRDARSRDERSIGAFVRRTDTYDHERCQPIGVTRPATLTKFHH